MSAFIHLSLFVALSVSAAFASVHVAVLETIAGGNPLDLQSRQYLTDELRAEAVKALPAEMNFTIMTRENITAMLPPGKSVEQCEGSCLVETGKNISADYVAQGRVGKFGKNLTLTVELYETAGAKLVGSFTSKSMDADGLLADIDKNAFALFSKVRLAVDGASAGNTGISDVSTAADYSAQAPKAFVVNVVTDPAGATLSIDGRPVPKCRATPCSVELQDGERLFAAALENYRGSDTLLTIDSNGEEIRLTLAPDFGVLNVVPVIPGGFANLQNLVVEIDGVRASPGENRLSPGEHSAKVSHPCYESVSFKAAIQKGKTETFSGALMPAKSGLRLSAEKNNAPAIVPVWVNGVKAGETPFTGEVPLCASIETGDPREHVPVALRHNGSTEYTVRMGEESKVSTSSVVRNSSASRAASDAAGSGVKKVPQWLTYGVLVTGGIAAAIGYYENVKMQDYRDEYTASYFTSRSAADAKWNKAKDAETSRNVWYGIGAGLLAVGATFYFFF
jgi:hypothetical protein